MAAVFTVDWEDWFSGIYPFSQLSDDLIEEPTLFLLDLLDKYNVKAIFYVLYKTFNNNKKLYQEIVLRGHVIGDHGEEHIHYAQPYTNKPFRSPYWSVEGCPGLCGGFFFRALPLWVVKQEVKRIGMFFIHPHDVMESHPRIKSRWLNFKRHIGLKQSRLKLERLLQEVQWDNPAHYFESVA